MDPKYTGDILRHLEKQNELLMDAYRSMSHELHKLQVEEEMLMHSFYHLMEAQGLANKKQDGMDALLESGPLKALVTMDSDVPLNDGRKQDGSGVSEESEPPKALVTVDSEEKQ